MVACFLGARGLLAKVFSFRSFPQTTHERKSFGAGGGGRWAVGGGRATGGGGRWAGGGGRVAPKGSLYDPIYGTIVYYIPLYSISLLGT